MDHITPFQRSFEDTVKHSELFMILKELRWRGKVLLEEQVLNLYSLPRGFVKTHLLQPQHRQSLSMRFYKLP